MHPVKIMALLIMTTMVVIRWLRFPAFGAISNLPLHRMALTPFSRPIIRIPDKRIHGMPLISVKLKVAAISGR